MPGPVSLFVAGRDLSCGAKTGLEREPRRRRDVHVETQARRFKQVEKDAVFKTMVGDAFGFHRQSIHLARPDLHVLGSLGVGAVDGAHLFELLS